MTEKVCPIMSRPIKINENTGLAMICLKEECMAWEREKETRPGYCKLIEG